MAFEKGHQKIGGRKKGSLNKSTLFLSCVLNRDGFDWEEDYTNAIQEMTSDEPEVVRKADKKIAMYERIMPFLVAAPKTAEILVTVNSPEQAVENTRKLLDELNKEPTTVQIPKE